MNEKFIADIHISFIQCEFKTLKNLGWEIQYDTLEYGKQNLNADEVEIDYENKKMIF